MLTLFRKSIPVLLGALLGFAYWRFIGCATGSCPITSTWYVSTLYGGLTGAAFLLPSGRKRPRATAPSAGGSPDTTEG